MLLAVGLAAPGCTYRAWYEGFQERQRQGCYERSSQSDVQKCLERVNGMTYEDYRRSREDPARAPE